MRITRLASVPLSFVLKERGLMPVLAVRIDKGETGNLLKANPD